MRCKLCRKKAIYAPLRFCEEHFLAYYEKKVGKYFQSTHARNVKILIGISGGKDSSALVDVLNKIKDEYGLELGLFTINLQIPDYSEKGLEVGKELAKKYNLPLIIEDLKDHAKQIPAFAGEKMKPCSQCGVIKRYLLNKAAVDNGYDYLATGHNLDDEFFVAMHNLIHRNVDQLRRQQKILPPKPKNKLAGRVKPLYYLTEKENRLYCLLKGIPHDVDECPFSHDNPQIKFKLKHAWFSKDDKKSLLKSVIKLQEPHKEVEEGEAAGQLHDCPSCGFPTTSKDECVYCKVMKN
ncbi:adenine nucleotide alpha hydrolase family protein [Candidatus Woesearchaeota archaeon]|nr:adenine nucleotide alpha hydrolase family protein [Candidatus Woesearchaeota archaeon]